MEGNEPVSPAVEAMRKNGIDIPGDTNSAGAGQQAAAGAAGADPAQQAAAAAAAAPNADPAQQAAEIVLTDDQVKKYLEEKHGVKITDMEELRNKPAKVLTEAEQKDLNEKIRADAVKFAITKDKFSTKDLEQYSRDSQRKPEDVAFEVLKAKWIKDDPSLDEEGLQKRFREYAKLDEPEGHWEREARKSELISIANQYFEVKYPKIVNAEVEYREHLQDIQDATEFNERVERVFKNLPTTTEFELELPGQIEGTNEKKSYKFSFSPEMLAEVKKEVLDEASFKTMRGHKDEGIALSVRLALLEKQHKNMVIAVAREYGNERELRAKAGRKGIIPVDNKAGGSTTVNEQPSGASGPAAAMLKEAGR